MVAEATALSRLWKVELQRLADEIGLGIDACHYPPGMSKWNAIEPRMLSHITQNWEGRRLIRHETIVTLGKYYTISNVKGLDTDAIRSLNYSNGN